MRLPRLDDLHVHLRQGDLLSQTVAASWAGGAGRVLAMPNLKPPLADVETALTYREAVRALEPRLEVLPTIAITAATAPDLAARAKAAGIAALKWYPQGVTTNSGHGAASLAQGSELFAAMQDADLLLSLHGELPVDPAQGIDAINGEQAFLPGLEHLHRDFPRLRIVLEHVSSAAAVEMVRRSGPTLAATVTLHHLELTLDDWVADRRLYCRPPAKSHADRSAVRAAVVEGHPRFFLGSDSAPHPAALKERCDGPPGIFTAPILAPALADCFDRLGCLDRLADFACRRGAEFHHLPPVAGEIELVRRSQVVPGRLGDLLPFRGGQPLAWSLDA